MLITFVVPAFNASETIGHTLASIYRHKPPIDWDLEVVVVDDGSQDKEALSKAIVGYEKLHLVVHEKNRGMCAARNSGIIHSQGDVVTILDSDDELVDDWPEVLEKVYASWPNDANVCYAACRNSAGKVTASEPDYQGNLFLDDLLNERHSGEYMPMFRGQYVRNKPYIDLGMRKSCGIVSYINFAMDGPFWISNQVLRIYNDARAGSVSHGWTNPRKARETTKCYDILFKRYADLYQLHAPVTYRTKQLRLAVYRRLAGESGAWRAWRNGLSLGALRESIGAAVILIVGPKLGSVIISILRNIGLIRRYG
jgi:glycosyltransferase involved in cell wall biosynthesis